MNGVRALLCCALLVFLALTGCSRQESVQPQRVLFVGNSLTYVGNLPAVYSALAADNGHAMHSDMIVRGGATLSQRVADGSVARALESNRYAVIVLQERGGDLMCSFGPDSCVDSRAAIKALVALAREHGADVVLLGTYQPNPRASQRLIEMEAVAAKEAGIVYVEVSEKLRHLRNEAPDLAWFAEDGMHPGPDLTLLNAMLVYQALHGVLPTPDALTVDAPIYGVSSGLKETLLAADAPPPRADTPMQAHYPAATMQWLHDAMP